MILIIFININISLFFLFYLFPDKVPILLFFFNDTATTEIYTLSLHDALPISRSHRASPYSACRRARAGACRSRDRKSTRLNSSHEWISYAVFCLKKKKSERPDSFLDRWNNAFLLLHFVDPDLVEADSVVTLFKQVE